MNEHDIKTAFGDTPAAFRHQVDQTLMQLEDAPTKKCYKFTTMLALTAIIVTLLAGAAIAATQLGLNGYLQFSLPEDPSDTVHTNVAVMEDDNIRCEVEEILYDGYGTAARIKITNLHPDQYRLTIQGDTANSAPNPDLIPLQCSVTGFISDAEHKSRNSFLVERTLEYSEDGTITLYASDFSHSYYHGPAKNNGYRENVLVELHLTYSQPLAADTTLTTSFMLNADAATQKYCLTKQGCGESFGVDTMEIICTDTMSHYSAVIYVRDAFIASDTQKPSVSFSLITPDGAEYPLTVFRLDVDHVSVQNTRGLHLYGVLPAIADMPDAVSIAMRDTQSKRLIEQTEYTVTAFHLSIPRASYNSWSSLNLTGVLPTIADMPNTVSIAMRHAQSGLLIERTECTVTVTDLLAPLPSF